MEDGLIRPARSGDFRGIAELITAMNQSPENQCIHCDTGEDADEILQEMERLHRNGEIRLAAAHDKGTCVGFLGAEIDEEGGRGWLRGPIVAVDSSEWNRVATDLWQEFLYLLPSGVLRLDAFPNVSNERSRRFYLDQGFKKIRLIHAYTSIPPRELPEIPGPPGILERKNEEDFVAMQNQMFPSTQDGERILSARDDHHRVFAFTDGEDLLGYLYATVEEGDAEGTVEFLGVREDARSRGIGLTLLQTALKWFFQDMALSRVGLVVDGELANAQALYERAGFRLKYTGVNLRKNRKPSP